MNETHDDTNTGDEIDETADNAVVAGAPLDDQADHKDEVDPDKGRKDEIDPDEGRKDENDPDEGREAELETEIADLKDKLLRSLAETENIRRRGERDRQDASKYAIAGMARDMLGVADNLRRALESVQAEARSSSADLENLCVGVEMTEKSMQTAFARVGIEEINAMGAKFDHNLHESLFEIEDVSLPVGTVVQVLTPGYQLNDRLLRPSQVGVAKGGARSGDITPAASQADDGATQNSTPGAYEASDGTAGGRLDEET